MQQTNPELISRIDQIEEDAITKSIEVTKAISAILDKQKLVQVLRDIIDASPCINFKTERAKKYINHERPTLLLTLDIDKVLELYPDYLEDFKSMDVDVQRSVRTAITQTEVADKIVDLFTAIFMYIKENEYPEHFDSYKEQVMEITKELDILTIKSRINNFFKVDNKEEDETDGFSFSITSVTGFPPEEAIFTDPTIYLEVVY